MLPFYRWFQTVTTNQRGKWIRTMREELYEQSTLLLLYVDIERLTQVEQAYGEGMSRKFIQIVEKLLLNVSSKWFQNKAKVIAIEPLWADDFAIYLSKRGEVEPRQIEQWCLQFKELLIGMLQRDFPHLPLIGLHMGYAPLQGKDLTKEIYRGIRDAQQMAKYGMNTKEYQYLHQFREILLQEDVHMLYQPIVSLKTGKPFGWEALARGPENSFFYPPANLFKYAEETKNTFQLEKICRRKAMAQLSHVEPQEKLFINLDPRSIEDPFLMNQPTPEQVVLEITERHAIHNFQSFRRTIDRYRKKGYLIAVDDAGAGYSSLEMIAELYPDFIKMDMSLVRHVDKDPVKRALLEAFLSFAAKVKCKIIAEGIEEESELRTLMELGVEYGQGYLLGKPNKEREFKQGGRIQRLDFEPKTWVSSIQSSIWDITIVSPTMNHDATVKDIHSLLENNLKLDGVVIVDQERPIGLIMRSHLYQLLGSRYGIPLYYEKPISQIMNTRPLIVDKTSRLEEVATQSMERESRHLYDLVIVTDQGHFTGIVSVQMLLDTITKNKIEMAAFSNPLTGLPGNTKIEEEIHRLLLQREESVIVYCDLDYFKQFNDQFGFEIGDQIILQVAKLIKRAVEKYSEGQDFIGHVGGDDFIFTTKRERLRPIVDVIMQQFCNVFKEYIPAGLSISIGAIYHTPGRFQTLHEISERSAQVKKLAKSVNGCSFVDEEMVIATCSST